ncbi:MAG: hypothetical protein ABI808_03585 [Pseudonocardiales bacterium]
MRNTAAVVVLIVLTSFGATACAASHEVAVRPTDGLAAGSRQVVMVSGRDDHGLVVSENVVLRSAPQGGVVAGRLPDGTLAQVREVRGNKVLVTASGVTGWVDDFTLRGELRLAGPPPGCRVRLAGRDLPAGTRVEVLSLDGGSARVRLLDPPRTDGTVATSEIVEVAPLPGQACPSAGSGRTRHGH